MLAKICLKNTMNNWLYLKKLKTYEIKDQWNRRTKYIKENSHRNPSKAKVCALKIYKIHKAYVKIIKEVKRNREDTD